MVDATIPGGIDAAEAAMQRGDFDAAIAALEAACRTDPGLRTEALLVECRCRAGAQQPVRAVTGGLWQGALKDPFEGAAGLPEIRGAELNAATLAAGIRLHGALLVRGFLPTAQAQALAQGVVRALLDCRASLRLGQTSPWYSALPIDADSALADARRFVETADGVWAVDSPRMLRELIDVYRATGLLDAITGYFGERPMLSVRKTTLRRVAATIPLSDWHQDGAFLGSSIRSVNLWLALSDCGKDASGLDVLPRRLERILPTGTAGACFDWAVGQGVVDAEARTAPVVTPHFAAGDALLFDHLFLHRTGIPPGIKRDRYAVESWFFAPSAYPADQVPVRI